jgi:two-component system, OmpR family, phosphate regulon sensor histidine kinase PhoR
VKHILHHHQASLQVESKPGEGSRFQIIFPAQRVLPA